MIGTLRPIPFRHNRRTTEDTDQYGRHPTCGDDATRTCYHTCFTDEEEAVIEVEDGKFDGSWPVAVHLLVRGKTLGYSPPKRASTMHLTSLCALYLRLGLLNRRTWMMQKPIKYLPLC